MLNRRKFTKLFNEHADALYRFAYFRVSNEEQAQDIVSIVFTKAWEKRETCDDKNPTAWLYTIARNVIIDGYRKVEPKRIDDIEEPAVYDEVAESLDSERERELLKQALNTLEDGVREIVHWRYIERLSVREVAERSGQSEANVRVIQHRALKELRKWYEKR
jgi:RNA polymerase sigma-70 factor (ECF subfamily)